MSFAYVYILTNRPYGVLYTGVTTNLPQRIGQHRLEMANGFTKRYKCKNLVWYEAHDDINAAIKREKAIKRWPRRFKIEYIEHTNPTWTDLFPTIAHG